MKLPRPDIDDLESHFRDLNTFRWVTLASLKARKELACMDGRHDGCVLGAPGGNMGEFILLLTATERATGEPFGRHEVDDLLGAFMRQYGRFHMHTDTLALEALGDALRLDPYFTPHADLLGDTGTFMAFLNKPPQALTEPLLAYLVRPEFVGCGHLHLMLERPEEYGIERRLLVNALKAFFRLVWSGVEEADYTVLQGRHAEAAVVTIDTHAELEDSTLVPTMCRRPETPRFFLNHWAARRYMQKQSVAFLRRARPHSRLRRLDPEVIWQELDELAKKQLAVTVGHLAAGLPHYHVVIDAPMVLLQNGARNAA